MVRRECLGFGLVPQRFDGGLGFNSVLTARVVVLIVQIRLPPATVSPVSAPISAVTPRTAWVATLNVPVSVMRS